MKSYGTTISLRQICDMNRLRTHLFVGVKAPYNFDTLYHFTTLHFKLQRNTAFSFLSIPN